MPGLSIVGVSHAFGAKAVLHDVALEVATGELVCLLGPSGCGKTTLLRLAAGLEELQAGRIAIAGNEVAGPRRSLPPERRNVGLVFQDFALFPHLTVRDNVAFGLAGRPAAERRARALALLETIGLAEAAASFPHVLSGGQQQRVALARALAPEPSLVLLDEPFSGLDSRMRERLRDDARQLLKGAGVSALMVTHDAEEAMFMADRIAVMQAGRILAVQTPHELYFAPSDAAVAAVFGEPNVLAARVAGGRALTALGDVAAPGHPEGAAVRVLLRPEGLRLGPVGSGPQARVVEARILGRTTLALLELTAAGGAALQLRARIASTEVPAIGAAVGLGFEARLAHVFPA